MSTYADLRGAASFDREFPAASSTAPNPYWVGLDSSSVGVSQQILTWLLFWPLLCLIARQAPYFAGPARDALFYDQGAAAGPRADYRVPLYVIMAIQAAFAVAGKRKIWATLKQNPLVLAGLFLILASVLWSGAVVNTLHMWVEVSLCTLFACYLSTRMTAERLMSQLMFMGFAASLLSILFVVALPHYGLFAGYGNTAWQGICDHKNTLGLSMAYLLTPVFYVRQFSRTKRLLYCALLLFIIAMSQSRGAWAYSAGVLGFVACLHLIRRFRSRELPLVSIGILALIGVTGAVVIAHFGAIASMLGKDASMSGRTIIYREVWRSIMKAPILGYGYGAFWFISPEAARIGYGIRWPNIGYAESGVLDLALQLGFVGVALVLFMLAKAVLQAIRLLRSSFYTPKVGWFLTILFLAVLTNIDAGWLLVSDTLDWVMILVACIGLEAETRRVKLILGAQAALVVHENSVQCRST